jgi:hypothetical protein
MLVIFVGNHRLRNDYENGGYVVLSAKKT